MFAETFALFSEARNWNQEEKRYFVSQIKPLMKQKGLEDGKKGKEMKKMIKEFGEG